MKTSIGITSETATRSLTSISVAENVGAGLAAVKRKNPLRPVHGRN